MHVRDWMAVMLFPVGRKGEKRIWRRYIYCLKASSTECTHHFPSHSIGRNLAPWPPNCWAAMYSGSSPITEGENILMDSRQCQPHWPQTLLLKRKKQKPVDGQRVTLITKAAGKFQWFSYSSRQSNMYLLSSYSMPGTVLGPGDNKKDKVLALKNLHSTWRRKAINKYKEERRF